MRFWSLVVLGVLAACGSETLDVGGAPLDAGGLEDAAAEPEDVAEDAAPPDVGAAEDVGPVEEVWTPRELTPVADWREADYIQRSRPKTVELSLDERTLFVGLEGNLIDPGREVLALDPTSGQVQARIRVGSSPQGMALSADGSKLYVACQLSNYLSVIDVATRQVVGQLPASFYAQDIAVSADGQTLYVSNRWLDAVEVVRLAAPNGSEGEVTATIPVGTNPRDLVLTADGRLYVGNLSATSISLVDPAQAREVYRFHTNAPINGLATDGTFLFAATLGVGDGHPALSGLSQGVPFRGDGTEGEGFSDINNDLIVIQGQSLNYRYTSDTAEVSHADVEGDYTAAELIVQGALPEQAFVQGDRLYVSMSSSDEVQVLQINPVTGSLTPMALLDTGINPFELTVTRDNRTLFVADRLGETVSRIDVATGARQAFNVGASARPYPATEYEIGEALFHSARISSEAMPNGVWPEGTKSGDKSCNHCHRETLTDGKVWQVGKGLLVYEGGERMPPSARNIRDTLPLFWEGVQDESDFDLEAAEFSPPPDFGCEEGELGDFLAPCAARDAFFRQQTRHLDPLGQGFDFAQVSTHLLGQFLVGRPRLLPNPDQQLASGVRAGQIARGRGLFHSAEVQCSSCHPSEDPARPFTTNQTPAPVISSSGLDRGLVFKNEVDGSFNIPSIRGVWDRPQVFFHDGRAKSLRSAILPPGHASLSEGEDGCHYLDQVSGQFVGGVVRPIYNGLGCNEVSGAPNTHGTTSQLTPMQVEDLLAYVRSIQ